METDRARQERDTDMTEAKGDDDPEAKRLKVIASMPGRSSKREQTVLGGHSSLHEAGLEVRIALEPKTAYLHAAPSGDEFEVQVIDWHKDYFGTKSGKKLDKQKVIKARELELESLKKLKVYEPIDLDEARRQGLEIVYSKWLDDEKPTASDPDAR